MAAKDVSFGGDARSRMVEGDELLVMKEDDLFAVVEK